MAESTLLKIKFMEDLGIHSHEHLFMLYRPLMGGNACELYEILCAYAMQQNSVALDDLLFTAGLNEGTLNQSRRKLEQYLLVSTFSSEDDSIMELHLYAPKSPKDFLRHEIFSRMLIQKYSAERFEKLKDLFGLNEEQSSLKNISETLNVEQLDNGWNEEKETILQMHMPAGDSLDRYHFNWEVFFKGMDRTIPTRLRTRQNMTEIAYLAHIYGLGELEIRPFVTRAFRENNSYIDFGYVVDMLLKTNKIKPADNDPYTAAPILYLKSLQPEEAAILPNEKALLADLSSKFKLSDEVINTLIEYCLKECNQAFVDNYIRKVANTWVRLKISTRKQALEHINSESRQGRFGRQSKPQQKLPDWYSKTENIPMSDELAAKIRAIQKGEGQA